MNYADLKFPDIANGTGVRVSLWVSGCHFHCKECHNPEAWNFNYGKLFDDSVMHKILNYLTLDYCKGLSILGGEPLEESNIRSVESILSICKSLFPDKDTWLYTGYTYESIKDKSIMKYIDVLVDGQFELDNKVIDLKFRGSTNQRIINVQESLKNNQIILYEE